MLNEQWEEVEEVHKMMITEENDGIVDWMDLPSSTFFSSSLSSTTSVIHLS